MASESASGTPRNELLLQYIQELGYDVDFKTSLAKLEKNSDGRITGVIAQSAEDDHFIRYNANQGRAAGLRRLPRQPLHDGAAGPAGHQRDHRLLLLSLLPRATASVLLCGQALIWTRRPLPCCLTAAS